MERYTPRKIIIDNRVKDSHLTRKVLKNLPDMPREYVDDPWPLIDKVREEIDPLRVGKRILLLTKNNGKFLKPCPGTKEYICCGYQILNFAANCNIECSYCILQAYLNNPILIVYANTDDMFTELEDRLGQGPPIPYRMGTGEFTDSLTLDHLLGFTNLIVPYFGKKKNVILELKTKTDNVANLSGLEHNGNTVVAWSLNTDEVAKGEELLAPPIQGRIDAAAACQDFGYRLAFHFDPLIYYPGWEKGYRKTIHRLFTKIDPINISWISLGCFRFIPLLKPIVQKRFPKSKIIYEEFIKGLDGKMRYLKSVRIDMYSKVLEWIKYYAPEVCVYLCMESPEVWRKVFGNSGVKNSQDLADMLNSTGG